MLKANAAGTTARSPPGPMRDSLGISIPACATARAAHPSASKADSPATACRWCARSQTIFLRRRHVSFEHVNDFYARTMSDQAPNPSSAKVADQLKALFCEVVEADLPPDAKGRWHKRLIAITNTAKHDVGRAGAQLSRFIDEWNEADGGKGKTKDESDR